ncbi:similar to Saccharomyces cerevisiae YBR192W RIM2 Mitochondrial pyrimidine nucleotide transporter [Maudiozyma saulgeensis]|uniref:Similar to Saccharomyces cerevisiae YBR192W RIM2 Mitochondrial pyrimidine nucleotide transporter n=1 Tax=Maudiozyma saulgeensis TaxID=1789683 RepID=A0A1X7R280_9SACH|nr:similar to Saccharomyces cerevisiae YBR192W RIM2 Mitochondrial pyrimidine nucleotide transporter [Kazachstania saulgeensis]
MPKKTIEEWTDDAIESTPYLASDEKSASFRESTQLNQQDTENKIEGHPTVKPWVHFVAGGIGGMAGAIVTCPFDLVKTRLQSDVYKNVYKFNASSHTASSNFKIVQIASQAGLHFKETCGILGNVYRQEGFRSLFKGLGPNLVGVIPARSINFFTYGTTKELYSKAFNNGQESPLIHLMSAATAGWATSTATNPIWMIKTRVQLDKAGTTRQYANSWDCLKSIIKHEGVRGLYKGLSASYLGSVEGILQWLLYEQMKLMIKTRSIEKFGHDDEKHKSTGERVKEWCQRSGSAGLAKFIASIVTYPHEVVRTRLRQSPVENGKIKYTGLLQSFRVIIKEEGFKSMYSGLTPHLMRTVPNSIIMFGTWEVVIRLLSQI